MTKSSKATARLSKQDALIILRTRFRAFDDGRYISIYGPGRTCRCIYADHYDTVSKDAVDYCLKD